MMSAGSAVLEKKQSRSPLTTRDRGHEEDFVIV